MKTIKKTFSFILLAAFLWGAVGIVRPFWHRYWLKKDMQVAAIYGTKNRAEDTRALLTQKMKERGLDITGDDFSVEKDERNRVYISLKYDDKISLFGKTLKELEFSVVVTASEVKEYF
ncbi:MAG: hypothetical protein KKE57_01920 [Proteobacteria bacterium]|nr:hypothetical protein [Pseudomonadota bacterium]